MNFQIRPENTQNVFLSEDTIDIVDLLKSKYDYIYESIEDEGFILKFDTCNLFKELICDKKVVGFCSYDFSREFLTVALNNIYILPEFRGNGIFLKELERTMAEHNKPSIMEPTRLVVELLIKYGFACRINENIVASAIEFIVPGSHVLSNSDYDDEELSTHFYDLKMCCSFHILDLNTSHIAYSLPLNYDIIHYDCIENRADLNDDYFIRIAEFFKDNEVELMNTVLDLEENLPIKKYTLEEVIGDEESFSPYIESLIDDAHVTYEKASEIKQQLKEEYESGMILNESLLIRLAYLFEKNTEPTIKSHEDTCPYCGMPIDGHDKFCHFCGINLAYDADEMQDSLLETINTSKSDFTEDIRFIAYKFLRLIDEKIDLDYSIFTIENTYNIDWYDLKLFLERKNYFRDYSITDEGYEFLDSHPLHFFENYHMDIVDYTDFENYFYENSDANPIDRCLDYLNQFDDDEYILEIID
ncbi:hypothetical protein, partial [Methanobrevibacter sp.]|uniref:hypothetical protein n=1 Tax=Methanobrevibacter sp. TaxID=66852 RepID=UPI00388DD76F